MKLVVIEGPGKRATISKYLGSDYEVFATKGHIRDLPVHGFGVDINHSFEPKYEIISDKKDVVKELKQKASKAENIFLATDNDREGESISWHVANVLGLDQDAPVRIVFNEISKNAVQDALKQPRAIDEHLVEAQQARRVLDRIVGYKLSPIICRKIQPKLSAGRVQSVTLKMIVDREREILNFKPEEYWSIIATLSKINNADKPFNANLINKNGKKIKICNVEEKDAFLEDIKGKPFVVKNIKRSITKSHAPAPYITSTMQQDALNKMGLSLKRTTSAAQNLYEGVEIEGRGKIALITYIRTDSVRVSPEAQAAAKEFIIDKYGDKFYPETPNFYKSKKSAQDAHEAIRPIYIDLTPDEVKSSLSPDNYKLYKLIYERFLASQMSNATYNSVSVDIDVENYTFRATGRTPIFAGYTILYQDYVSKDKEDDEMFCNIPELTEGEILDLLGLKTEQKFTKPPARYTEASLVKAMDERGIGRPATYTPTVSLLFFRKYTENEGKSIKPTELGCQVNDLLCQHFPEIMDITFTAKMEDDLDEIADGNKDWHKVLEVFYGGFQQDLKKAYEALKSLVEETDEICDKCGSNMVIRNGKYGKFLACSNYPTCKNVKNISEDESEQTDLGPCPECGGELVIRSGKYGKFIACKNYPDCAYKANLDGEEPKQIVETDKICDKCGHKMVERTGKYGKFLACSNYPKCKNIVSMNKKIAVCPRCGKDIIEKHNKKGDAFYGCTGFPQCTFVSKDLPTDETCPKCNSPILRKETKTTVRDYCSNTDCDYLKVEKKEINE